MWNAGLGAVGGGAAGMVVGAHGGIVARKFGECQSNPRRARRGAKGYLGAFVVDDLAEGVEDAGEVLLVFHDLVDGLVGGGVLVE